MKSATRGERFAKAVRDDFDLGDPGSELLLDEIAAVVDTIDRLPTDAITERRQQRLLLSRLVGQLALPNPDDDTPGEPPRSVHARKAAAARWGKRP
jgi:hypothetical protein